MLTIVVHVVVVVPLCGQVTTRGSDFDTVLAVYRHDDTAGLPAADAVDPVTGVPRRVGGNDDCRSAGGGVKFSCVTFSAVADVTYDIQVGGINGATGEVSLAVVRG